MGVRERRLREQADRSQLIVSAARHLAEVEGWDAVTTRRLADMIEYSQPVLYQHFSGKQAIVTAVAVDGFIELAGALRAGRRSGAGDDRAELRGLLRAYVEFGVANPVLYEAMFTRHLDVEFAGESSPGQLVAAFDEFTAAVASFTAGCDVETLSEVVWSCCHGLVDLEMAGRLRAGERLGRIETLVDAVSGRRAAPPE